MTALNSQIEDFFKPEVRKSGQDLATKNVVFISSGSDTQIQAFVRASGSPKVNFTSTSITARSFTAGCSCTAGAKGHLCKHIWATLLTVQQKYPDFLECKSEVEAKSRTVASAAPPSAASIASAAARSARAEEMKTKQADYRRQQYQKQKDRAKEIKRGQKKPQPVASFPEEVRKALQFFADNGFELEKTLNEEDLSLARKKLSRIFHPDKGGTHDEALVLNENFSIIEDYLHSKG